MTRHGRRLAFATVLILSARATVAGEPARPEITLPGLTPAGKVLLPNGWSLKPAGSQTVLGDFPVAIALNPAEPVLAILHAGYGTHEVVTVGADDGKVIGRVTIKETFAGLVWSADGKRLYVGGGFDDAIHRFDHAKGLLSNDTTIAYPGKAASPRVPAGLAMAEDGSLWVANAFGHSVAKFDPDGKVVLEWPTGKDSYPYGLAYDHGRGRLYVSLWNGAEVAALDAKSGEVVAHWPTQEHPNELLIAPSGERLYVANANRNTVTVIDLDAGKPIETIGTAIDPNAPAGSMPSSLALTEDESVLFVANAATNDLAVVNVKEPGASQPLGFIPTGWFPTCVRLSKDGKTLYVTNGKGTTSKANRDGPNPLAGDAGIRGYIGSLFQGTLARIPLPGPQQMVAYTKTVYECSPLRSRSTRPLPEGHPISLNRGGSKQITHVVYIIKENRTYDQVLGDIPEGNGEKSLCLFGEDVTPNHHALAREFVLLDNFYVDGEVSADGHEWSMGAFATDYVEKTWPLSYRGDRRVPYPSEGALAIARPAGGYLWDRAAAKGVTYRSYGEFIKNGESLDEPATTKVDALQGHFDPKFHGYDLSYPDVKRAERFLEEVAEFEKAGEMPRLMILRLPNDHTSGTRPGAPTPTAMVAENDLAFGKVVEGLTRSKYWPHLAIFVVEDDAQNGPDHVDAHRTIAFAISPYIKRHSVDSSMYSTSSMLRTIELILGLDPMSQFDAAARPMANAFTSTPDLTPYRQRPARVDIGAKNTRMAWGAAKSMRLDLDEAEDRADDLAFNEIIWKSVKGANSPLPPPVRSAFVLPRAKAGEKD
jgi:YVTN family beta-propeller protein